MNFHMMQLDQLANAMDPDGDGKVSLQDFSATLAGICHACIS
jgi:hypothetical protein